MAGAAPGFAAGWAGSLPTRVGEMQMVVAHEAYPPDPQSPIAGWRLDHANGRMPVDAHGPFAFASFDQHVVAMHGGKEHQSLRPIDCHPQIVIAAQIVELGGIFTLDGGDPERLALRSASAFSPDAEPSAASFSCAVRRRSS